MGANKIVNMLIGMRHEALNQQNLTELDLPEPSQGVIDAITKAGGKIDEGHKKRQLCRSDICDHKEHAKHQYYRTIHIPQSWILENPDIHEISKVFFIDYDDNKYRRPWLIVPTEMPALIYEIREEHFFTQTYYTNACSIPPPDSNMCDDEYYHFLVNNLNKSEGS